jgi:uncharacterized protein involved in exopolysaccharide biosynthesis
VALVVGLVYTFARPAEYRGAASVRVVPAPVVEPRGPGIAPLGVGTTNEGTASLLAEAQVLTSASVLEAVASRLAGEAAFGDAVPSVDAIERMVRARPAEGMDADVVELGIEGPDRGLLSRVLQAWVDVYLGQRVASRREATSSDRGDVDRQLEALEGQIAAKRQEIDDFRARHEILSTDREDNEGAAQLKRLNRALEEAVKKQADTEARAAAVRRDLAAGRPVLRPSDKAIIAGMEGRAQDLREKLADAGKTYTERFMQMDPKLKDLRATLADLEARIARERQDSARAVLIEAEQDAASAQQTVETLRGQVQDHKRAAQEFTARFAQHQALLGELQELEGLYNGLKDRRVRLDLDDRRETPEVQLLAPPFVSETPFRPDYLRDAGISVAGSLTLGLLAVWLVEFLRRPPLEGGPGAPTVQIAVQAGAPGLGIVAGGVPLTVEADSPRLEGSAPPRALAYGGARRELSLAEAEDLWASAGTDGRLVVAALLSGLGVEELAALRWEDVDLEAGALRVPGPSARVLPLRPALRAVIEARAAAHPRTGPLLADGPGDESASAADIDGLVASVARDAGLADAESLSARDLRHTYVAFLVRQGARLGEIEGLVGRLSPADHSQYGPLSPPGPRRPLEEVQVDYLFGLQV